MQAIKLLKPYFLSQWRSISRLSAEDIVITSAVRTPLGIYRSCLAPLNDSQLGTIAIHGALLRSRLLLKDVQALYLNNSLKTNKGTTELSTLLQGQPKNVHYFEGIDGLCSIIDAVDALKKGVMHSAVAGSICSVSAAGNKPGLFTGIDIEESELLEQRAYVQASMDRAHHTFSAGLFTDELVPVRVQRERRSPYFVHTDEILLTPKKIYTYNGKAELADGAAALVLATKQMAERWQLRPLARIVDYAVAVEQTSKDYANAAVTAASQLLHNNKLGKKDISMWEVDDPSASIPLSFIKQLELDPACVNMHGGALSLGYPLGMNSVRALIHLLHALEPGALGCAVGCEYDSSDKATALLLQKVNATKNTNTLPKLTMYTKVPCPLCDIVLEELEQCFSGQCEIEKVFIDEEGNERWFELFKNDIPVLFLNGQFLCMHKLNSNLLKRKLNEENNGI